MHGFQDITGYEETVRYLKSAISTGSVSHAYLIQGPEGAGKRLLSDTFAGALQCERGGEDACGVCASCKQAAAKTHPDIIHITHAKPGLISVEEIRTQVVGDVAIRPYRGPYKIYIIPDAEKMNDAAQNALLKTLEEPPEYAVLLLLTVNAAQLLETIRSRCVLLNLKPVKEAQIQQYLMEHLSIPDYQARLCAAFAQGSIGKAMKLAGSDNFGEIRELSLQILRKVGDADVTELIGMIKELQEYKLSIREVLDLFLAWYRDVLYFKATRDVDGLIFQDQVQQIQKNARTSSYEGINTILGALEKAKRRLDANVSFDLSLELLLLTMKEN